MDYEYDLFVIGAGSGGVRGSRVASMLGAKVAVAEDSDLGGTCVNVGCVPKKLFVYASQFADAFSSAKEYGWDMGEYHHHWPRLRDNKSKEIKRLNGIYEGILDAAKVEIVRGKASIVDPHTVEVGSKRYTAEHILIATGGWPRKPVYPGAEYTITSNDVFYLEELPKRVLVEGGGYIAVEFAGIFNGLGCDAEIVYRGELFLRSFDQEIRQFVSEEMANKGVKMTFRTSIEKVEKRSDGSLDVYLSDGEVRNVDAVLSSIGRIPKTQGLGLENTQVHTRLNGSIIIDNNFRTNEPSIFAIGDVVGRKELTPVALAEGTALANYLFDKKPVDLDYRHIATAIFSQPNVGTIGYSQESAEAEGLNITIYKSIFKPLKHTVSGKNERMMMKLIVDADSDKVIGAHMAGEEAGEIMQGLAIAIKAGVTKAQFDATIGIHPTAAEEFVTMRIPVASQ